MKISCDFFIDRLHSGLFIIQQNIEETNQIRKGPDKKCANFTKQVMCTTLS